MSTAKKALEAMDLSVDGIVTETLMAQTTRTFEGVIKRDFDEPSSGGSPRATASSGAPGNGSTRPVPERAGERGRRASPRRGRHAGVGRGSPDQPTKAKPKGGAFQPHRQRGWAKSPQGGVPPHRPRSTGPVPPATGAGMARNRQRKIPGPHDLQPGERNPPESRGPWRLAVYR